MKAISREGRAAAHSKRCSQSSKTSQIVSFEVGLLAVAGGYYEFGTNAGSILSISR